MAAPPAAGYFGSLTQNSQACLAALHHAGYIFPYERPVWFRIPQATIRVLRLAMPFYEYELCEGDCVVCGGKFTLRRPLSAAELTKCPACKRPVRKLISTVNSPMKLKPLSVTDAKKAGFTIYKKLGKGEYERQ